MTNDTRRYGPGFLGMLVIGVSAVSSACGSDAVSSGPGLPGSGATNSVGNTTGGVDGLGGSSALDSTGGAITGGGVGATGGSTPTGSGLGTGGVSFWKNVTYNATALPDPSNGNHNAGQNCIQCHTAGTNSEAPAWLFAGTVYQADGTTPAAHVQVGVNDGANLYTAYSATNGNFWFGGTGTINWAAAQVRIRNGNGELTMAGATPASTCNLCHNSTTYPRITAP